MHSSPILTVLCNHSTELVPVNASKDLLPMPMPENANDNYPCKLLVTSHSFESSVTLHILKVNVLCSLDFHYNTYSDPASISITIPLLPLFSSHFLYQYHWFSLSLLMSSLFQLYTFSLVIINPLCAFKYVPIIHKGLHVIQTLA